MINFIIVLKKIGVIFSELQNFVYLCRDFDKNKNKINDILNNFLNIKLFSYHNLPGICNTRHLLKQFSGIYCRINLRSNEIFKNEEDSF